MSGNAARRDIVDPEIATGGPRALMHRSERLLAMGYGLTYDAVVSGFPPYEALLDEVFAYVDRSARPKPSGPPPAVLDVSCGVGTVAARLAARGYDVTGIDVVAHLIDVARRRHEPTASLRFEHADVASAAASKTARYDVIVSMHTLYWHPRPDAVIAACRRLLKPGGHAVFLTYSRPAHVAQTFADVRASKGIGQAFRSLRWLLPTALFEMLRHVDRRYLSETSFHGALGAAGFEILDSRETFLAGISRLAWVRSRT
ncbi:MAG TPA: methyltransferase domain-containing protein [Methylomirabilota bacterium]|jgi:SAM-dependent methyltransferase|nr:methyltransferase domain-containing protein [Methylomirabilota bacterium]